LGSGVLARVPLLIDPGAPIGLHNLGLTNAAAINTTNTASFPLNLNSAQIAIGQACGVTLPGEIHGTKWDDQDGNGVRNGEPGVSGVSICLHSLVPPDEAGTPLGCTNTNVNGDYQFTNLPDGYYRISETVPPARIQTFPANGASHFREVQGGSITGVDFGNQTLPPGAIQGHVFNDANGNGIEDGGESGLSGRVICLSPAGGCVGTNGSGDYSFPSVAPGNYNVYMQLPSGSANTTPMSVPVTVTSGNTVTGVNFGSRVPMPPPPEVSVGPSWNGPNGIPAIGGGARTFTKDVTDHCGSNSPVQVKLVITSGFGTSSQMMTNTSGEIWAATISPPTGGLNALRFYVDCPPDTPGFPENPAAIAGEDEIQEGGNIYVDPSGTILDCNGNPLSGVTVTLVRESPPDSDNFISPATSAHIPSDNPEITAADGVYGWVVIPGVYKVVASKAGYVTAESAALSIPPAVTDLNLSLATPDDGDCDGVADTVEAPCGSDPMDVTPPISRPERVDGAYAGVDDDGDTLTDEALPGGASAYDCDGDGYTGADESHVYSYLPQGSGDQKTCQEYDASFPNANPDVRPSLRWPSDLNKSAGPPDSFNRVNILDLTTLLAPVRYFGTDVGTNTNDVRFDLRPGPGLFMEDINIEDLTALLAGASGFPPMLASARAFDGGTCPYGP
jgi:hypothetical protein